VNWNEAAREKEEERETEVCGLLRGGREGGESLIVWSESEWGEVRNRRRAGKKGDNESSYFERL